MSDGRNVKEFRATVKECKRVSSDMPPDGEYDGIWGAYSLTFNAHGFQYIAKTDMGVRTPAAAVKVVVRNGIIGVK